VPSRRRKREGGSGGRKVLRNYPLNVGAEVRVRGVAVTIADLLKRAGEEEKFMVVARKNSRGGGQGRAPHYHKGKGKKASLALKEGGTSEVGHGISGTEKEKGGVTGGGKGAQMRKYTGGVGGKTL